MHRKPFRGRRPSRPVLVAVGALGLAGALLVPVYGPPIVALSVAAVLALPFLRKAPSVPRPPRTGDIVVGHFVRRVPRRKWNPFSSPIVDWRDEGGVLVSDGPAILRREHLSRGMRGLATGGAGTTTTLMRCAVEAIGQGGGCIVVHRHPAEEFAHLLMHAAARHGREDDVIVVRNVLPWNPDGRQCSNSLDLFQGLDARDIADVVVDTVIGSRRWVGKDIKTHNAILRELSFLALSSGEPREWTTKAAPFAAVATGPDIAEVRRLASTDGDPGGSAMAQSYLARLEEEGDAAAARERCRSEVEEVAARIARVEQRREGAPDVGLVDAILLRRIVHIDVTDWEPSSGTLRHLVESCVRKAVAVAGRRGRSFEERPMLILTDAFDTRRIEDVLAGSRDPGIGLLAIRKSWPVEDWDPNLLFSYNGLDEIDEKRRGHWPDIRAILRLRAGHAFLHDEGKVRQLVVRDLDPEPRLAVGTMPNLLPLPLDLRSPRCP